MGLDRLKCQEFVNKFNDKSKGVCDYIVHFASGEEDKKPNDICYANLGGNGRRNLYPGENITELAISIRRSKTTPEKQIKFISWMLDREKSPWRIVLADSIKLYDGTKISGLIIRQVDKIPTGLLLNFLIALRMCSEFPAYLTRFNELILRPELDYIHAFIITHAFTKNYFRQYEYGHRAIGAQYQHMRVSYQRMLKGQPKDGDLPYGQTSGTVRGPICMYWDTVDHVGLVNNIWDATRAAVLKIDRAQPVAVYKGSFNNMARRHARDFNLVLDPRVDFNLAFEPDEDFNFNPVDREPGITLDHIIEAKPIWETI